MQLLLVVAVFVLVIFVVTRLARPFVYDLFIVKMTSEWYKAVLERLPNDANILDVGIGTGTALFRNKRLLLQKNVNVTGIDYDADYVKLCAKNIRQQLLTSKVRVSHVSVYDYQGGPFDAAYFSGSLMIMPDPVKALTHVTSMLKPDGKIYVTQTFETKKNPVLELVKPFLKFLTTIDFGQVTYEKDFLKSFEDADLEIIENLPIAKSSLSAGSFRLIIGKPRRK